MDFACCSSVLAVAAFSWTSDELLRRFVHLRQRLVDLVNTDCLLGARPCSQTRRPSQMQCRLGQQKPLLSSVVSSCSPRQCFARVA
jgi:hypothetical protein